MRAGRLTSSAEFRRVYADGRRASSPGVVIHVLATGERRPGRVGVSVARGVGNAVRRNRVKRRLREAVRPLRDALAPGVDAVIVGNQRTVEAEFQEVADNVRQVLIGAGALDA